MASAFAKAMADKPAAFPAFAEAATRRQVGPLSCSRTGLYAPRAKGPAALLDAPF